MQWGEDRQSRLSYAYLKIHQDIQRRGEQGRSATLTSDDLELSIAVTEGDLSGGIAPAKDLASTSRNCSRLTVQHGTQHVLMHVSKYIFVAYKLKGL